MKTTLKVLAVLTGCIVAFLIYVRFTFLQQFDVPANGIAASTDSAVVARGKYLVTGVSHCYSCHMPDSLLKKGLKEPMMGGLALETPFATFNTPNITSDQETGTGKFTDEQLARAIRYNLNHKNNAMVGFMSYNSMGDEDLTAIVSYLRTTTPVKNKVPPHDYNMLGKILMRFMVKPYVSEPVNIKPDTTAEYGRYLAYHVANCNGCHTNRDSRGKFIGDPFGGGKTWDLEDASYTAPNLTPHDTAGRIVKWSQEMFIQRFHAGKLLPNTPMPWEGYEIMSDNDLKAIYKFLQNLPPAPNRVEKTYAVKYEEKAGS